MKAIQAQFEMAEDFSISDLAVASQCRENPTQLCSENECDNCRGDLGIELAIQVLSEAASFTEDRDISYLRIEAVEGTNKTELVPQNSSLKEFIEVRHYYF